MLTGLLNTSQEDSERMTFPGPQRLREKEQELWKIAIRGTVWTGPGKPSEIIDPWWVSLWSHRFVTGARGKRDGSGPGLHEEAVPETWNLQKRQSAMYPP